MEYHTKQENSTNLTIAVTVPYPELEPFLLQAAEKISAETEIEGFRKGKAPYEVVKQRVGEFKILEEASRLYIQKNFEKILEEVETKEFQGKSFEPVGEPNVAITKLASGQELEYKITLFLLPPLELPDYRAVAKKILEGKKIRPVTEEEIKSSLDWLRESRAQLVTVRREAAVGDRVEVDFSASHGGVRWEGGESKNHPLILGQGRFLPGFEDHLIGMKSGEEKSFTVTVPHNWRDRALAGKSLDFKVKMGLVQERIVPKWDDQFAQSLGNFTSAEVAEKSVRDGLAMDKEAEERERLRIAMVEAIARETNIELPDPLISRELEKMIAELRESVSGMGLTFNDYLTHIKKTEGSLKQEWRAEAERRVGIALVLRGIARTEGIRPNPEDTQQAAKRIMAHRGVAEEERATLDSEAVGEYAQGVARNEKVFQWLESLQQ